MVALAPIATHPIAAFHSALAPVVVEEPAFITVVAPPRRTGLVRFARINGWPIEITLGSARELQKVWGSADVSYDGRPLSTRRGVPRAVSMDASLYLQEEADALEGTLAGRGHHFPFDLDAHSESGIGPDTVATGNWSIDPMVDGLVGAGVHGSGYLNVSAEIVWDVLLREDRWTVMYWRNADDRSTAEHCVVRSDGAKWLDGVRDDALNTAELTVDDASTGAVALDVGTYDDLVIFEFNAAELQVEEFYRWTTERRLVMHVSLQDGTARDVLENVAAPTLGGTVGVLRHGGKVGGAIVADAAGEVVTYPSGDAYRLTYTPNPRGEFSVEAWIYPNSRGTRFIAGNLVGAAGWDLSLQAGAAGRISVRARVQTVDGTAYHESPTEAGTLTYDTIPVGAWAHVQFSWSQATGKVELRLNGREVTRTAGHYATWIGADPEDDSALDLLLGNDASGTAQLDGRIGEFRINRMRLTYEEVRERYLCGIEGLPGPEPRPCSALPRLILDGEVVGSRSRTVLGETSQQAIIQRSEKPGEDDAWHNNARTVPFTVEQVADDPRQLLPRPLWSFSLAERYADALSLRPSERGVASATLQAAGTWARGAYGFGRARVFGATTDRVNLDSLHATALYGLASATVIAWVKRDAAGGVRGIMTLATSAGVPKLELEIDASGMPIIASKPATTDTLRNLTGTTAVADDGLFHLVGGYVDVANDEMGVFLDDAGLALPNVGDYETAAKAFGSTRFSAETAAGENGIGVIAAYPVSPWSGRIASVAVYPGVLTAEEVHRIWQAGRRGTLR